jgi:peptidoglycan-associated lipoprotein
MKRVTSLLWILPLVVAVSLAGCAKKKTLPEPAPAPAPEQPAPPPPAPAPTPEPPPPAPTPIQDQLQDAFYALDSANLDATAQGSLDADGKLLTANTTVNLTIEGHCDERGTVEYNQALGDRRAEAAKAYLVRFGIQAARLNTISYGKEKPFDPGHDEAAWAKNRRAHLVVR